MYIIYSQNLQTQEITPRSKFATRKAARINLLKEAQQWLLEYRTSDGNWELIAHKFEAKGKESMYYIKRSDKNENKLVIYQNVEVVNEGYIWNSSPVKILTKVIVFDIMEIPDDDVAVAEERIPVAEQTMQINESVEHKRKMIKEISLILAKRRERIE